MTEPTIETLARRLDRVERENRILKWAVAGVFVLGTVAAAAAHEEGWVLLTPPLSSNRETIATTAPLREWKVEEFFGSVKECKKYRAEQQWMASSLNPDNQFKPKDYHEWSLQRRREYNLWERQRSDKYNHSLCVPVSVGFPRKEGR